MVRRHVVVGNRWDGIGNATAMQCRGISYGSPEHFLDFRNMDVMLDDITM